MKKLYAITSACLLIILLYFFLFKSNFSESNSQGIRTLSLINGTAEYDEPGEAIRQDIERTKDPVSGTVPVERLELARSIQLQRFADQQKNEAAVPGISWTERGPNNVGGRTRALLFDNTDNTYRKVWAGGVGGGLWYTNDITAPVPSWNKVSDQFDNLAITCITQHPDAFQGAIMFMGTGEGWYNGDAIRGNGIYRSMDGGASWTQLPSTMNNPDFYYVNDMKYVCCGVGPALVVTTRTGGIQRSTDLGNTWTKVLGNGVGGGSTNEGADLEFVYNYVYATMGIFTPGGGIFRSNNGGQTWSLIYASQAGEGRIAIANNPNAYWDMYALVTQNLTDSVALKKIIKTEKADYDPVDVISSWVTVSNPVRCSLNNYTNDMCGGQGDYDLTLIIDPKDPFNSNTVYIGGIDLYKTVDGGGSWQQLSSWAAGYCALPYVHSDEHAILFRPNYFSVTGPALDLLIANDGGIFRTTDGGGSFTNRNRTYNVTQFYSCAIHPATTNYFLGGTQDNGSLLFTSAGMNTTTEVTGGDGGFCFIDQDHPDFQITSYIRNSYFISQNGGGNFNSFFWDAGGSFINPAAYDDDANILYAGAPAGEFFRWGNIPVDNPQSVPVGTFSFANVTHVAISPQVANRVYFGLSNGSIIRVDNANATPVTSKIIKTAMASAQSVSSIAFQSGNEAHMLVTYSNYGVNSVFETTDGLSAGTPVWNSVEGNLPDMPVRWVMFDPRSNNWAILATEKGIWSTDNLSGGFTDWQPTNNNFANTRVDMLQYRASDGLLLAATHGRGLFSASIPVSSPLPVALLEFSGSLQKNEAHLFWITEMEENNKGFEILRSEDGIQFRIIGFVASSGNSLNQQTYAFTDPDITQPVNYYRLRIIDDDGSFSYSKIIVLKNPFVTHSAVELIGNPFVSSIDLQLGAVDRGVASVRIFNAAGALVLKKEYSVEPFSRLRIKPGNEMPVGVYFMEMVINKQIYRKKLIKQ